MLKLFIIIVIKIIVHPSNRGEVINRLLKFLGWQVFKRFIGCPILIKSCDNLFLAYPDCTISFFLIYFKTHENEELSVLKTYFNEGKAVFIDVGANIGFHSIVLRKYFLIVHAFEPNPEIFRRLKENVMLNGHTISANNVGVSDREGEMYLCSKSKVDSAAYLKDSSSDDTIPVRVVSLDNYIEENLIKERLVMKIDVEGGELKVLQGTSKALKEKKFDIIQFEVLNEERFEEIRLFIESFQYDIYTIINNKLQPVHCFVKKQFNYFFIPSKD